MDRMVNGVMQNGPAIQIGAFLLVLVLMTAWEFFAPRRKLVCAKSVRWLNNLGLVALNAVVLRLAVPTGAIGFAEFATSQNLGLFNRLPVGLVVATILSIVVLDFVVYVQRRIFHRVPILWRLHMVHHADPDIEVTTGVRFCPLEILISLATKAGAIVALGASTIAALAIGTTYLLRSVG